MSTIIPGIPSSFVTTSSARVAFNVPAPPPPLGGHTYHNQGVFHAEGHITANYHNTFNATFHNDIATIGAGYLQNFSRDDYRSLVFPAVIDVPPFASGTASFPFSADFNGQQSLFGKDPIRDLFCGPGQFWVGLLSAVASIEFHRNIGNPPFSQIVVANTITATFDLIEYIFDVVDGLNFCGSGGTCPPCTAPGDVPTGHPFGDTAVCATQMTGVAPAHTWVIFGAGLVDVNSDNPQGWYAGFSGCNILVSAPCQDYDPALIGTSAGVYTVIVTGVGGVAWIGTFNLIYAVRCHEIVRVGFGADGNPFNLQDSRGFYHGTGNKGANAAYWRSDSAVPIPGWAVSGVTIATGASEPRVYNDYRGITFAVYTKSGSVYRSWSLDDGATWRDEALAITGGTHPTGNCDTNGTEVIAAYVGPVGGPGVIKGCVQDSGDTAMSAAFTFLDDTGAAIVAADDTFHVYPGREGPGRWLLHMKVQGAAETSHWWNTDGQCKTWKKI